MAKFPGEDIKADLLRYRNLRSSFKVYHGHQLVYKD